MEKSSNNRPSTSGAGSSFGAQREQKTKQQSNKNRPGKGGRNRKSGKKSMNVD